MKIKAGTSDNCRWAAIGRWRAHYYPDGGGSEGFVLVDGFGWVVDTEDEMPHDVWIDLLRIVGAPITAEITDGGPSPSDVH